MWLTAEGNIRASEGILMILLVLAALQDEAEQHVSGWTEAAVCLSAVRIRMIAAMAACGGIRPESAEQFFVLMHCADWRAAWIQGIAGGALPLLLLVPFHAASRGRWIGGADIRILSACGIWIGAWEILAAVWIASVFSVVPFLRQRCVDVRHRGGRRRESAWLSYLVLGVLLIRFVPAVKTAIL